MLRADENEVKSTSMFFLHLKDGTTCVLSTVKKQETPSKHWIR